MPSQQQKLSLSAQWGASAKELPVYFLRYEDMKADPVRAFAGAARFIGLDCTQEQVRRAVGLSSFDRLKAEEDREGFKEKPYKATSFFRAGKAGDWRNHLSDGQRERLIADHGEVMRQYGYLDAAGNPDY